MDAAQARRRLGRTSQSKTNTVIAASPIPRRGSGGSRKRTNVRRIVNRAAAGSQRDVRRTRAMIKINNPAPTMERNQMQSAREGIGRRSAAVPASASSLMPNIIRRCIRKWIGSKTMDKVRRVAEFSTVRERMRNRVLRPPSLGRRIKAPQFFRTRARGGSANRTSNAVFSRSLPPR